MIVKTKKIYQKRFFPNLNSRTKALASCPQKRGVCKRVYTDSPKKPNSAKRKVARVILSTRKYITVYIPGETHTLHNFSAVLIRGGRVKDMPGINYKIIRGKYDCQCLIHRRQGRSKVGTKGPKNMKVLY